MKYTIIFLLVFCLFPNLLRSEKIFFDSIAPPGGGEVFDIEIDSFGNLYICSQNGVFRSSDKGENWKTIIQSYNYDWGAYGAGGKDIFDIIAINKNNDIVIANKYGVDTAGILYSTDLGNTWKNWHIVWEKYDEIFDVEFDNNDNLYIVTNNGKGNDEIMIYYSDSLGSSWKEYGFSGKIEEVLGYTDFSILNDSCIAIVGRISEPNEYGSLMYITSNSGKLWKKFYFTEHNQPFCVNYFSKDEIFIGTRSGAYILKNYNDLQYFGPKDFTATINYIFIPNRKNIFLSTGLFVAFSLDSGVTWEYSENFGNINLYASTKKIRKDSEDNLFVQTYRFGYYRSTDGGKNWFHPTSNGFFNYWINGLAFDKDNNIYIATHGLYKSTDNGKTWDTIGFDKDYIFSCVFVSKKNYIYASAFSDYAFYRSKDEGNTWEYISYYGSQTKIVEDSKGNLFGINSDNSSVIYSFDDGDTWYNVYVPEASRLKDITINWEDDIFVTDVFNKIFKSYNQGMEWNLNYANESVSGYANKILFNPEYYIGFANIGYELIKTTNNGRSWFNFREATNYEVPLIRPLAIDSLNNIYWLCFDLNNYLNTKLVKTDYNGDIVDTLQSKLDFTINFIEISPDGYVWGASNFEGLYRSRQPIVSVEDNGRDSIFAKDGISLHIYPNPAAERIYINYGKEIPLNPPFSKGEIEIYNVLGVLVKEIPLRPPFSKGEMEVDVSRLPPGIYYITLKSGEKILTKQFAVIK